jgi:hypothetical protein
MTNGVVNGRTGVREMLPGEHVLAQSKLGVLTLTNRRVQLQTSGANTRYVSITHDSISSCGLVTTSQPLLLVLGILAMALGMISMNDKTIGPMALIVGVVMVVLYFLTRTAALLICSNGGERIHLPAQASEREALLALLQAVDCAKLASRQGIELPRQALAAVEGYPPPPPSIPAHTPTSW